eukprot:TRINITY_DN6728_c0_g1_i1.p1 TRINITY_DN6728_c0_g1~~TRINITY_DN6728_c0_g1_i1.p1  ORF type:complete len:153 (-),score=13.17 TRINITY_DN6728_c0_g1_i1:51-446(-)
MSHPGPTFVTLLRGENKFCLSCLDNNHACFDTIYIQCCGCFKGQPRICSICFLNGTNKPDDAQVYSFKVLFSMSVSILVIIFMLIVVVVGCFVPVKHPSDATTEVSEGTNVRTFPTSGYHFVEVDFPMEGF